MYTVHHNSCLVTLRIITYVISKLLPSLRARSQLSPGSTSSMPGHRLQAPSINKNCENVSSEYNLASDVLQPLPKSRLKGRLGTNKGSDKSIGKKRRPPLPKRRLSSSRCKKKKKPNKKCSNSRVEVTSKTRGNVKVCKTHRDDVDASESDCYDDAPPPPAVGAYCAPECGRISTAPQPSQYEVDLRCEYLKKQQQQVQRHHQQQQLQRSQDQIQLQLAEKRKHQQQTAKYVQLATRYAEEKRAFQDFARRAAQREGRYREACVRRARCEKHDFEKRLRRAYSTRMNRRLREMETKYRRVLLKERSSNRKQMREVCRTFSRRCSAANNNNNETCRGNVGGGEVCYEEVCVVPTRRLHNSHPALPPPCPPPCPPPACPPPACPPTPCMPRQCQPPGRNCYSQMPCNVQCATRNKSKERGRPKFYGYLPNNG